MAALRRSNLPCGRRPWAQSGYCRTVNFELCSVRRVHQSNPRYWQNCDKFIVAPNTSPLWSAYGGDETARLTGSLGMGGLFGSEGGPDRVRELMATYQDALWTAPEDVARNGRRTALMTAG